MVTHLKALILSKPVLENGMIRSTFVLCFFYYSYLMASTKLVLNYANFVYLYDVLSSLNFFKHKDTPAERKKIFQDKLRINSNPRFVEYLRRKMFGET